MKALIAVGLTLLVTVQTGPAPIVPEDLAATEAELREEVAADPEDAKARYNLGTVLLMRGQYEEARPVLESARADDEELEPAVSYNLGNTDLEPAFADSLLPDRPDRLRRAIDEYKRALRADPTDIDAKWNLELAWRLLESEDLPPQAGGGGGGAGGGGGGGSGEDQEASDRSPTGQGTDPTPSPAGGSGDAQDASEDPIEELLRPAQEREMEVQRERLRKPRPPTPMLP